MHRRVGSLEADWFDRNGRSFTTARREYSIEAEASDWKCEDTFRDPEAWGRKLDFLANKSSHSPKVGEKRAAIHDLDIDNPRIFRFCDFYTESTDHSPKLFHNAIDKDKHINADSFIKDKTLHKRPGSGISLAYFTLKTTSAATKTARWIEFWSNLAEKKTGCL